MEENGQKNEDIKRNYLIIKKKEEQNLYYMKREKIQINPLLREEYSYD